MRRRLRLLLVPILAVALPLVALAAIGYQWLMLDREAAARRTQDAALAEATRLRAALLARMASAAAEVDRDWQAADQAWPFALRPRPHLLVTDAYRFTPAGRPEDPDYDAAYQGAVRAGLRAAEGTPASDAGVAGDTLRRTRLALTFLGTGRRALAGNRPSAAIEAAESLLECCAAARDEFGVSLAVLAGRQLSRAWRQQGLLPAKLPGLVARLVDLVDRGAIGHPNDLVDVEGFIAAAGDPSAAAPLLARLEAVRGRGGTHGRYGAATRRVAGGFGSASGSRTGLRDRGAHAGRPGGDCRPLYAAGRRHARRALRHGRARLRDRGQPAGNGIRGVARDRLGVSRHRASRTRAADR